MTTTHRVPRQSVPLSDAVITAVAQMVDDAQSSARRDPSHSDIDFEIRRCRLTPGDPKSQGRQVGKMKRVREVLSWAMEKDPKGGETFVAQFVAQIRGLGGFRPASSNYIGAEAIRNAREAFRSEGYELTEDGELRPLLLDNLSSAALTEALQAYVRRAKCGVLDAALVTGTGKDLVEATAAHILMERYGDYQANLNFPTLLAQVFIALGLATSEDKPQPEERPQKQLERGIFLVACVVNRLRNKEGTGHGRPWLTSVADTDAKAAVELMGVIAEWLLRTHKESG
jgi:hypothetical protein